MIEIKFGDRLVMEKLHNALVGSPAYINSEIAIVEDGDDGFILVVGNPNDHNIKVDVDDYGYYD